MYLLQTRWLQLKQLMNFRISLTVWKPAERETTLGRTENGLQEMLFTITTHVNNATSIIKPQSDLENTLTILESCQLEEIVTSKPSEEESLSFKISSGLDLTDQSMKSSTFQIKRWIKDAKKSPQLTTRYFQSLHANNQDKESTFMSLLWSPLNLSLGVLSVLQPIMLEPFRL